MSESARTGRPTASDQSPTSVSIDALEEIVRNCQRNEQRLHDLERHTRHERKKAERLLRDTSRSIQDRDSRNTSLLDSHTGNDTSRTETQTTAKVRPGKEFYVPLDDEADADDDDDGEAKGNVRRANHNDGTIRQDKHLLERVEKLLAGDGTTTSSDVMSSHERQRKAKDRRHTPIEDEIDENLFPADAKLSFEPRHLPSACSIEQELSSVDRLLSERTPVHRHRQLSDKENHREHVPEKTRDDYEQKKVPLDQRDEQFYERLNNYVHTGRFVSPDPEKQRAVEEERPTYLAPPVPKPNNKDDELSDLARRCEDLLSRLHAQRSRAEVLERSPPAHEHYRRLTPSPTPRSYESQSHHHRSFSPTPPPPMTLQQALELLRPEFISRSRQRARRVRLLREEREHNTEIDRERQQMLLFSCNTCYTKPSKRALSAPPARRNVAFDIPHERPNPARLPVSYREMKQATKKKYQQLPEVNDRRRQAQMEEIRRRNILRAKVFRARLRQHVIRNGRTNIDESLTMIDT